MFVFSVFPLMMHCSSDDTSDRVDETGRAVTLSLDSTLNKFYVNDVIRYRAITTSSDGRIADVTGSAQWALAHEVTAKFESSGTVRGLAVGVTKLTVTFEGQTVELDITVRDLSEEIKSIAVEPSSGSIPKDYSIPLMAKGLYVDGQARDISALCEWKTLTPAIVEIRTNSIGPQLHGVEIGEAKVEAGFAGLTGEGFYSVELLGLEEIEVFPFDLVLPLGSTYQLLGLGRFQKGELMEVTDSLSWISSDPTKLEVSDEAGFKGALTAVGEGFATISATSVGSEAVVGSCTVAVTSAHVESLTVDPAFVNIHAGTSAGMTAAAVLGGGYALDVTELATWTIADETVATIHSNPEGGMILEAVSSGATSMTISYSDATVEQPITIKEAVLVSLNLFTAFEEIPSGGDAEFYLLGIFGDNTQGGLTDVATWASSNPDVAFVSNYPNAGKVKGLFPGETTITASYGDFSVNADLTVTSAEVVSVQAMPAISAVPLGDQVNYNAVAIFRTIRFVV